ncbi:MAG: helix-turn-helix domain-containing protein [Actinomycetota bacterium]|nr:helix-turn-helix domain-containing protein [Actinomycetota bacterium]
MSSTTLPERVRRLRRAKGLTLESLAFASGLSVATIQRIETGKHAPNIASLTAVAAVLDTTPGALLSPSEPMGEAS